MRELAKSIGSFSWAMTLYGARQLGTMMNPDTWTRPDDAAASFEPLTRAAAGELDGPFGGAWENGDRLQRAAVDGAFSALDALGPFDPRRFATTGATMMQRTMGAAMGTMTQGMESMMGSMPGGSAAAARDGADDDCGCGGKSTGWGDMPRLPRS
ncbi:MAG TPA: hypothetical protein VKU40_05135 [Thermoanaerobaculia bacterium]|nr:hypothetical protein [Thermoanaerobaculia bacterium]